MRTSSSQPRPSILVVEDDSAMQEAVASGLADTYTVHTAATGREACACLCAHSIAAIILDVFLGTEHGLDLMPRFRALAEIPILILTGHGSEEIAARALRERATDYLMKPFTLGELRTSVALAVRPPNPPPNPADPFARVHRHMTGHLAEPHTATSLAREMGVSERHLRRVFQDACGHTPRCHLNVLRIRQAADLLHRSTLGISRWWIRSALRTCAPSTAPSSRSTASPPPRSGAAPDVATDAKTCPRSDRDPWMAGNVHSLSENVHSSPLQQTRRHPILRTRSPG